MSDQSSIANADLSRLNRNLKTIDSSLLNVNEALGVINSKQDLLEGELQSVNLKQDQMGAELISFATAFADYVRADMQQKNLQLAETRQGNLKQDLQIKFGYYAEVRRMATGILQAVDTGVVGDDTLKATTEEVMIKAPGYWLAPALVALVSWIRDSQETSEKALTEALARDNYKTTLFFMLVMRRLNKNQASLQWLERYFINQNPHQLDREFLIILEAVVTGVFPSTSVDLMKQNVKKWLYQLTEGDEYINEQKTLWIGFFESMIPADDGRYPQLRKFATNWMDLENSLKESRSHAVIHSHFNDILSLSDDLSKNTNVQLDEILSLLVTNFDDEELPMQEQVRLNELIIELEGDTESAQKRVDSERFIFNENVDFLQLLTNASFNPELSGVTKVTQALAVSISQPWIIEAYSEYTQQCRKRIPQSINIKIEDFETVTADGKNEDELVDQHAVHYQNILEFELKKVEFSVNYIIFTALFGLLGAFATTTYLEIGLVGVAFGCLFLVLGFIKNSKDRKIVRKQVAERELASRGILKDCIAEIIDYRKYHISENTGTEEVKNLLNSIAPEEFSKEVEEAEIV